jgi:ubiquinone/menaquinone biosynthesis C-methylase UbiE
VDLGSGSGYFALKLSSEVGSSGTVHAVDIRRLPLVFLWVRSFIKDQDSVRTVVGQPDDPRIPAGAANAVLIANTYHEFENREAILRRVFEALVPGGRLVIVEPMQTEHGELPATTVEGKLRQNMFEIVSQDDRFIDNPARGRWWLVIARRP